MTDDLRARLIGAAAAGEIISIVYHRGSQPGAVREVVPLEITVSSTNFEKARTFARLPSALALFLEEARKLAPRLPTP